MRFKTFKHLWMIGLLAVTFVGLGGCGSDQPAEGIRPLPSNKGGLSMAQHHPGQGSGDINRAAPAGGQPSPGG